MKKRVIQNIISADAMEGLYVYVCNIFAGHCNKKDSKWFNTFNKKYKPSECLIYATKVVKAETVLEIKQSEYYKDCRPKRWCVVDGIYYPSISAACAATGGKPNSLLTAYNKGQRYYKPMGQGREYRLDEIGPKMVQFKRIIVNGKTFKSMRSIGKFYGFPNNVVDGYIANLGKPDKGTFTYKGEDYHFEFLDVKENK